MREKATSLWFVLAASLLAATDSCGDAGGGFRLPEGSWRLRELAGRKLYACFHDNCWARDWDTAPDWPMMKNVYMIFDGDLPICEIAPKSGEYAARRPGNDVWHDTNLTFQTVLERNPKLARTIAEFERKRPGMPYTIMFRGYGRPFLFPKAFPQLDRASYRAWRAEHPSFHSFYAYDEWDNCQFMYSWSTPRISDPDLRASIEAAFPPTNDYRKWLLWTDEAQRRLEQFYFGEKDMTGLVSTWPQSCFDMGRVGVKLLFYEAELGSVSAPWRWGGACVRGYSRQFDRPFGWYCATYLNDAWDRNGVHKQGFIYLKSPIRPNAVEKLGCARSLLARNVMYGYFIGANVLQQEKCWDFLCTYGKNGELAPSVYAEDFNAPFAFDERHDRGYPYTPLALLVSVGESLQRQHYVPYNRDKFTTFAFLETLVPSKRSDPAFCSDRRHGDEGCLFNSEFGEIADVISPDCGQAPEAFYRVLKSYPRAVLMGNYDHDKFDYASVERYVKEGGTLYVEQRSVDLGYVPAHVPGAKGRLVTVPAFLPDYFRDSKDSWFPTKMAKITSGDITFPEIAKIYRSVQDELMPVKVEGDVQWGVNRSGKGWFVWLMNNRGVTHYPGEDEVIDASQASVVKVTDRVKGRVFERTVPAGGWSFVEISD